jgi:hypothetical protein
VTRLRLMLVDAATGLAVWIYSRPSPFVKSLRSMAFASAW